MKKLITIIIALSFFAASSVSAREGVHYFLPKVTAMFFDGNPSNSDPLLNAGIIYGYGLNMNSAMELDANYGLAGGTYEDGGEGRFEGWSVGGFWVYRYPVLTEGYLKGKLGGSWVDYDHHRPEGGTATSKGFEIVYGGGFGYAFKTRLTLELEYTRLKNNAHNAALGLHYAF